MTSYAGHAPVLYIDIDGDGPYAEVAQVVDIEVSDVARNAVVLTNRDSSGLWREYGKGIKSSGSVILSLVSDYALTTQGPISGIISDLDQNAANVLAQWRITLPQNYRWEWTGFVVGGEEDRGPDSPWVMDIEIAVTGKMRLYDPLGQLVTEGLDGLITEGGDGLYA